MPVPVDNLKPSDARGTIEIKLDGVIRVARIDKVMMGQDLWTATGVTDCGRDGRVYALNSSTPLEAVARLLAVAIAIGGE